jgi:hypothetical protein
MAIPYVPSYEYKTRYNTTFEVMRGYENHPHMTSPSGAHASKALYENTYWKAGTVLDLNAAGFVVVAPSGKGQWFALQNVEDMSGNNGYRNLQNTTAARGEVIGCQFGAGMAATAIHGGSGKSGDVGVWDGSTLRFIAPADFAQATMGKPLCRLEHADGSNVLRSLNDATATAGDKDTPSNVKAIIRFSIPLV